MIKSIRLKNYKAFEDVEIPIKPLTILLGANSVGKSSITQMLMLLHQTSEENSGSYSSALKIYGEYVNVGAFENLFKGKITSNPLSISLVFEKPEIVNRIGSMKRNIIDEFRRIWLYSSSDSRRVIRKMKINSKKSFSFFVNSTIRSINQSAKETDSHFLKIMLKDMGITPDELKKKRHTSILQTYHLLDFLVRKIVTDRYKIDYEISLSKDKTKLFISKLTFYINETTRLISYIKKNKTISVESDIVSINAEDKKILNHYFDANKTLFECVNFDNTQEMSMLAIYMYRIMKMIMENIVDGLKGNMVNYVSPLRAHPKRYYFLDKAKMTISLDTLNGDEIAEVLKENNTVRGRVNDWFQKFGLSIDVKGFKEVIHHVNVTQNNLSLDITDVGFGISQVLPIIIQGFMSTTESLTIIEQPEIHLHPRMQADLGDLFIDIITSNKKNLIIETHSEYMLKRIRRRISEGKLSSDDVSICLFHPKTDDKEPWVEVLQIEEKGRFTWPEDFYGGELYNDTVEFLKNQIR